MQLTYYNNKSDKRYLKKKLELLTLQGHANPVNITLLENTSLARPTFKLADKDLYMTANYCYVDDLHRYYHILDREVSNGFAYIKCECDVKMSFVDQFKNNSVVVSRNQWDYNLYQVDDRTKLYNFTSTKRIEFPSGFDKDTQQFILCVIGNTTGGDENNAS